MTNAELLKAAEMHKASQIPGFAVFNCENPPRVVVQIGTSPSTKTIFFGATLDEVLNAAVIHFITNKLER